MLTEYTKKIFEIASTAEFNQLSMQAFHYQLNNNQVYKFFVGNLTGRNNTISNYSDIPFLPISFFKTQKVCIQGIDQQIVFTSSGTTGTEVSRHHVADLFLYEKSFIHFDGS